MEPNENSLLSIIRNKLTQPTAAPELGATEQAGNLLRTKLTGQAAVASGETPKRSTIGEQTAATAGAPAEEQRLKEARMQAAQQGTQSAQQLQSANIAQNAELQQRQAKVQQAALQASSMMNKFSQQNRSLQTKDDLNQIESIAAQARLSNSKYVDALQLEGARGRLDNQSSFNESYQKQVLQDNLDILGAQYDTKKLLDTNDRQFAVEMQNMSIETALKIAAHERNTLQANAMYSSIGGVVSGGLQSYSAYVSAADRDKQANALANAGSGELSTEEHPAG